METRYIYEFTVLAEMNNYQSAADALYISQSSLSKHIQALEKSLGITLFDRTTRTVRLSAEGVNFRAYALRLVQVLDEYNMAREELSHEASHKLTIASTAQMAFYDAIMEPIALYKKSRPAIKVNVLNDHHEKLKALLRKKQVDFIWIGESESEQQDEGFVRIPFQDISFVALIPVNDPLARAELITVDLLNSHDLFMEDSSSIEQTVFTEFCRRQNCAPKITSMPTNKITDFASRGLGIAITFSPVAKKLEQPGVAIVPVAQSPIIKVTLMYLKDRKLNSASSDFMSFVLNYLHNGHANNAGIAERAN